ncbi:MAG: glycosyltransferase [Methanobacteriota archaeon]
MGDGEAGLKGRDPIILFVAMSNSIHTTRYINQLAETGWDLHLFPSIEVGRVHPELQNTTVHYSEGERMDLRFARMRKVPVFGRQLAGMMISIMKRINPPSPRHVQLRNLIDELKPDIIHTMETQAAGYLASEARKLKGSPFPKWIHTIWGSDLSCFGEQRAHREKISEVLSSCDYFTCECERDVAIARDMGFRGEVLAVSSVYGGLDFDLCSSLRQPGPTSLRKSIMLKGYQGWAGRALVGVEAIERCADVLGDYEVVVYVAAPEVAAAAESFSKRKGIPVRIVPLGSPHTEILRGHGMARISIGLSMTDGLPSSIMEAMAMGSFPIQSNTACADRCISHGKTGMLVPPEDCGAVEEAIRFALSNDKLLDDAAEINLKLVEARMDMRMLRDLAIGTYQRIYIGHGVSNG